VWDQFPRVLNGEDAVTLGTQQSNKFNSDVRSPYLSSVVTKRLSNQCHIGYIEDLLDLLWHELENVKFMPYKTYPIGPLPEKARLACLVV
jgi:hypothetical protein